MAAKAESQEENDWMMEDGEGDLDERLGIENPKNANNENGANFNRALQKAAGHMENTFVAAFAGVILAVVLLRDRETYASQIRVLMPQKKFDTMAFILRKFFLFMQMSVSVHRPFFLPRGYMQRFLICLTFSMHLLHRV